jgi:hypothetical protein
MESERLVQRFVDQELSAHERVQFLAKLVRDEALRERAIGLEQLLLAAGHLPKPILPAGFVAGVMDRIEHEQTVWQKITDAVFARPALRWNLASAVAGAFVALLAVWASMAGGFFTLPGAPKPNGNTQSAAASGMAAATPVLVRLVVVQPGARSVQVAGDFNGWNPASTPLEEMSGGAWTVTLPLQPGRYEYMFVVDGQHWIVDPFASEQNDDGFGSRNAVLEVSPLSGATL